MKIAAIVLWLMVASLAVGFGIVDADPPQPKTSIWIEWDGQTNGYCPVNQTCS